MNTSVQPQVNVPDQALVLSLVSFLLIMGSFSELPLTVNLPAKRLIFERIQKGLLMPANFIVNRILIVLK